jgi:enoyl-CoA hydratase
MIRSETVDGVRILRMEFGAANALGPRVVEALVDEFKREQVPTVITGEGSVFSAGLNLVELDRLGYAEIEAFIERFSVLMMLTLTARFPLVAAVNGHAVAGGCVLSMACDHRIGVDGPFKIGMNEVAIGLTLPAVVTEILRGKLAVNHARTVILGGALFSPADAVGAGLLDEIAPDCEAALHRAIDVAKDLGKSPAEFAAMKGSLVAPITERLQHTREALDIRFVDSWFSDQATALRRDLVAKLTSGKS